jgi:hypothetical protein
MHKNWALTIVIIITSLILFNACINTESKKINRAFYFWKSTFEISKTEQKILQEHHINTLYVKYFDVMWNAKQNKAVPVAKVRFKDAVPSKIKIVPVVFITNNALLKTQNDSIIKMANHIAALIQSYQPIIKNRISEIQIDCDWTLSTKEKYFKLLQALKSHFSSEVQLSATIRLHQIKYAATTGIPPVNKGMLMYYNMGNINSTTSNSIFNETDAAKYAPYIKQYPLALDAALPAFSWLKVFRKQKMHELLNQITFDELLATSQFKKVNENTLKALQTGHYKDYYFLTNDIVISENCEPKLSYAAAKQLHNYFNQPTFTLALFQLNQNNLSNYDAQDFENIFTSFN